MSKKFFVKKRSSGISAYVEGLQVEGMLDEVNVLEVFLTAVLA